MKTRVVVLGAGFGGLELCSMLAEHVADRVEVTLIDKNDAFVFGFSKLDIMFGRQTLEDVSVPYRQLMTQGLRFRQETITAIDPEARRVTTSGGTYDADVLVVALGADCDASATPGLVEAGHDFYTVGGVLRLRKILPAFRGGRVIVGIAAAPFKCPPAPSECALMLAEYFTEQGVRDACDISLVMPFPTPVPPSPDTSRALMKAFEDCGITFVPNRLVRSLDPSRKVAILDDDSEMPFDLFLGVPKHRVPDVVTRSGMVDGDWIPVDARTLATRYPSVYAVGDVTSVGTPKAGVFAEGAAKTVAQLIIASIKGGDAPAPYAGKGSCYVQFGVGRVGRVDVDFFSGPAPTGTFAAPTADLAGEKTSFGSTRRDRWFGVAPH